MKTRLTMLLAVAAGCGSKAPPPAAPVDTTPRLAIALAGVPAEALTDLRAVSYLSVDADGKRSIGKLEGKREEINVSALAAVAPESLVGWFDVADPPVPLPPEERVGILGSSLLGQSVNWGDIGLGEGGLAGFGEYTEVACGEALHLDFEPAKPVAVLIADTAVGAGVMLEALDDMPRPVALLARGDDPRGRALRLVLDDTTANLEGELRITVERGELTTDDVLRRVEHAGRPEQVAVALADGATAGDLLTVLAGLAMARVPEVVLDRGAKCQVYDTFGGGLVGSDWGDPYGGYGGGGIGVGGGGNGGGDGYGSIGHGGGTGSGYGTGGDAWVRSVVKLGEPKIKGDADAATVVAILEYALWDLVTCRDAEPDAKLTVTFTIAADGKVSDAKAKGAVKEVNACVETAFQSVTFAAPGDGKPAKVTIPIEFTEPAE